MLIVTEYLYRTEGLISWSSIKTLILYMFTLPLDSHQDIVMCSFKEYAFERLLLNV